MTLDTEELNVVPEDENGIACLSEINLSLGASGFNRSFVQSRLTLDIKSLAFEKKNSIGNLSQFFIKVRDQF